MFWCPVALKRVVEFALQHFPDGLAVGFDDHAALDDFGGLRHVALRERRLDTRRQNPGRAAVMGDSAIVGVFFQVLITQVLTSLVVNFLGYDRSRVLAPGCRYLS